MITGLSQRAGVHELNVRSSALPSEKARNMDRQVLGCDGVCIRHDMANGKAQFLPRKMLDLAPRLEISRWNSNDLKRREFGLQEPPPIALDPRAGEVADRASKRVLDPSSRPVLPPCLPDGLKHPLLVNGSLLTYHDLDQATELLPSFGKMHFEAREHGAEFR
jgi:hypothetical protein